MVLGVRGIPNVQGGVETHAEQLYQRLATLGCDVEMLVRTPFVPVGVERFGPIRLCRLWSPRTPGLEALVHSFLGVIYAAFKRPDILHVHAVGPAIITPIARLLGLRVVVTHHGPDYDRDKWGCFARWVLRTGERFGMRYSHARIAISKVIADLVRQKYGKDSELIPNGVLPVGAVAGVDRLQRFGLQPGRYFLQVSRMVPEKRQLDLIAAYAEAQPLDWKLVLVGGLTSDPYSIRVKQEAEQANVVLTDFLTGEPLRQIYAHAGCFVLPSSHEGLPIAILEALSYGLPVLASDIPANLEIGLDRESYFPVGSVPGLAEKLRHLSRQPDDLQQRMARKNFVQQRFDWHSIAQDTMRVYRQVLQ